MEGSIEQKALARLMLTLVGDIAKRAEVTLRPHSVADGEGVGDSYRLDGRHCQLSCTAPPEMELVAMTLQAFDCWEAAVQSEDVVTASAAALALGCSVQESKLVTSIQRTTGQIIAAATKSREGNSRGGRGKQKWSDECDQLAAKEYKKLRRSSKLSDSCIYRQIAVTIRQELRVEIGWQTVRRHLRNSAGNDKARP